MRVKENVEKFCRSSVESRWSAEFFTGRVTVGCEILQREQGAGTEAVFW